MLASLYMVVILGCTDDMARCDEIARVGEGWATAAACEETINEILTRQNGADYPMVAGRCEAAGPPRIADVATAPAS